MRTLCSFMVGVLFLVALAGIGFGVACVLDTAGKPAVNIITAILVGVVPFAIGVGALTGATIAGFCDGILREAMYANTLAREQLRLAELAEERLTAAEAQP